MLRELKPEDVINTWIAVGSVDATLRHYGFKPDSSGRMYVADLVRPMSAKRNPKIKKSDFEHRIEEIRRIAPTCGTIYSLLQAMGIVRHNSTLSKNMRLVLEENNISLGERRPWKDDMVYVADSKYPRSVLAIRVKRDNWMNYQCAVCSNSGNWNGKELKLQIDHIDGNNTDHRKQNLRWLCPNCHTQTPTFCRQK